MPLPIIESIHSASTLVRPIRDADVPPLMRVNGDPEVTRYLPYPPWHSPDDGHAWLARMRAVESTGTARQLVVEHLPDHDIIGTLLLLRYEETSARAELGFVFRRDCWGRGLARDTLAAFICHLFERAELRRLEAQVHPDNEPSHGLLRRFGFAREGLLRQRVLAHGVPCDIVFYGLLKSDWSRTGGSPPKG